MNSLDITDSIEDQQKLRPDVTTIDMPEVKDIPGQEHVRPPRFNQFADVTSSSDDEEGVGVLDSLNADEDDNELGDDPLIAGDDAELPEDEDQDDEVPHDEDEDIDEDDDVDEDDELGDDDSDITDEEKKLLDDTNYDTTDEDDEGLKAGGLLDDTDDDGDPLEEKDGLSGRDLDVPGSDLDDADEDAGDEDEENNEYSGDDKNETEA